MTSPAPAPAAFPYPPQNRIGRCHHKVSIPESPSEPPAEETPPPPIHPSSSKSASPTVVLWSGRPHPLWPILVAPASRRLARGRPARAVCCHLHSPRPDPLPFSSPIKMAGLKACLPMNEVYRDTKGAEPVRASTTYSVVIAYHTKYTDSEYSQLLQAIFAFAWHRHFSGLSV